MEILIFLSGLVLGGIASFLIVRLFIRSTTISKKEFDNLTNQLNEKEIDARLWEEKYKEINKLQITLSEDLKIKEENIISFQRLISSLETKEEELNRKLTDLDRRQSNDAQVIDTKQSEINRLNILLSEVNANYKSVNEKLEAQKGEFEELRKTSQLTFEKIANQILEEKTSKFTASNKISIEALLKPISENIDKFKKQVEDTYDKEAKERFSLGDRIKELVEQTNKISDEANNLTSALKGQSKTRGDWGEMILESILEKSGLVKGREYSVQTAITNDEGRMLKPDVLINLPDERVVIVDSKVSLISYDKFCSAEKIEDQNFQKNEHLKAIKKHIEDLSAKQYDDIDSALDFTMMFVPIEPAYLLAMQSDPDIWSYAYQRRILLISPTNLIACLKLIADLWKREQQSKNAMDIVKRGELLYDKFILFTYSIDEIGKNIQKTQATYDIAIGQLKSGSGNLIAQAIKLKALGLKSGKEVPKKFLPSESIDDTSNELLDNNNPTET